MLMRKNRHLHSPTGILSSAIHDIKNIHVAITIPQKKTSHNPRPKEQGKKKKRKERKADSASVCFDGEQARRVNGPQCARLLFLPCITATPQPDELAALPQRTTEGQTVLGATPQRHPTHGSRFPLSLSRSCSLLFHYVMLWQATPLEWLTGARLDWALNVTTPMCYLNVVLNQGYVRKDAAVPWALRI